MLNGLTTIHVELTNRCNKSCWMCGRRERERENPGGRPLYNDDMDFEMVKSIAKQLPPDIVVQLYNNGESLLYPKFGEALELFKKQITCTTTNGKLLVKKADEIIGHLDTIAISIIEKEYPGEKQIQDNQIKKFLEMKSDKKPFVIFRLLGDVNPEPYKNLGGIIATRVLYSPTSTSFTDCKKPPSVPEIGICLNFLNRPAVSATGDMSICVTFDPEKIGVLGNLKKNSLEELWNGKKRRKWLEFHKQGKRNKIPLCKKCEYWGSW